MRSRRTEVWIASIVALFGLVPAAIAGLWWYMRATATPLHPDPQNVPSVAHAAVAPQWADAAERGRQIVRTGLIEQNLPGLSVAVGVGGDLVWAEGLGWADIERKTPVKPDMLFRIGTASTALTSAAAGLLLEKGRLNLDDEIQTSVPEFPRKEKPVTLRQLMAHTSGLRTDGGDEGPLFGKHCERPADGLHAFAELPLLSEPGARYRYSSYGWIVVSASIEGAAHEPFLTFMQKEVFEPLAMHHTEADSATDPAPDRVTIYFPRFAADPRYGLHPMRPLDYSCYAGASVFLSTPSDLVRFAMGINGGKLLKPATVELLQTSQRLPSGEETGYGLGWDLETVTLGAEQAQTVGHDGEVLGGTAATLMTLRAHGITVAVISNISYADTPGVALKIAEAFAEQTKR